MSDRPHTDRKPARDVERLRGCFPGLLQAEWVHALTSILMSALMIAAARLRSQLADAPIDLIGSLLRVVALAFTVRACLALVFAVRTLRRNLRARLCSLTLEASALIYDDGRSQQRVERADILGLAVPAFPRGRLLAARGAPLHIVLKPSGGRVRYLTVPPYFTANSEILAARLTRFQGEATDAPLPPAATGPASEAWGRDFERAERGEPLEGAVAVERGNGVLLRAPYSGILGLAFGLDLLRNAPRGADLTLPLIAAGLLYALFLAGWLFWMRRRAGPPSWLALLFTKERLLVGTQAGPVSLTWSDLTSSSVAVRQAWSPFWGSYPVRVLELETRDGQQVRVDQGFLAMPAEVVAQLCAAFQRSAH